MKTVTLFDVCRENYIPTVLYSANPETIQRWKGRNLVAVHDGYAWVEEDLPEQYVDFKDGRIQWASIPDRLISIDIFQLASILNTQYDVKECRIYFYNDEDRCIVCGID